MFDKLWSLGKLGILLTCLFVLGSWIPEITPGFVSDYFNKGEGGIVIIDSPEVYSRERLINDRFRQVSWLEDELDKSPDLAFGNQAISDLHQILKIDTKIGNTTADDPAAETNPVDMSPGENTRNNSGATVSPSERFRDVRAYREEIRTEMMETLLDDRHDIKGNTLYRLKFDTTVLPQENTEKMVVIQVKLARAGFCEPADSADTYKATDSEHLPCISIRAIHDSWLRQTEEKINAAIEGTINSFKGRNLTTPDFAEFVRYLQKKVSNDDVRDFVATNVNYLKNHMEYLRECVGQANQQYPRTGAETDDNWDKRTFKIKSCPRKQVSSFFSNAPEPKKEIKARYDKVRQLLLRFYRENLKGTKAYSDLISAHIKLNHPRFDAFKDDLEKGYGRWMLPLSRRDPIIVTNPDTPDEEARILIGKAERIIAEAKKIIAEAEFAEQELLRYVVVGLWIDKYTYSNDDRLVQCKKLFQDKLEVFDPKSLSCIAHLEKTVCKDVDYCTVKVEASIPELRMEYICDGVVKKGSAHHWCQVRDVFKRLLQIDEAYYSYAITPKESAQRVLTIASERRQKQLALSLIASSSSGMDPATVSSITKAISDSATQIEQIQRKPLILSFGRGQPVLVESNADDVPRKRGIDFGWVIGPKFLFSDRSDNKIKFYHAPVQNSLSAVISVPSWWTAINLEIDTCWIDQNKIPRLKKTIFNGLDAEKKRTYVNELCNPESVGSNHGVDIDYLIRLPGSAEELPRKFGYEIERLPAISDGGILADFYVGQKKASLIIQGQELWRSTVVTMGHQKADNIEVLPNMKGIIATFNTVGIPSKKIEYDPTGRRGRPVNCFVLSEIVVWTSEGRTPENQLYAKIHANPLLGSRAKSDQADVYPNGFGDCTITGQQQKRPREGRNSSDPETEATQASPNGDAAATQTSENSQDSDASQEPTAQN